MSIIGLLPAPGKPRGAADVLGQAAFAYGAGSSVVVLEVSSLGRLVDETGRQRLC